MIKLNGEILHCLIIPFLDWPRGGMVDTKDLKSLPFGSAGSSPAEATTLKYNV